MTNMTQAQDESTEQHWPCPRCGHGLPAVSQFRRNTYTCRCGYTYAPATTGTLGIYYWEEVAAPRTQPSFSPDHPGWYIADGSQVYVNPDTGKLVEIRYQEGELDEVCAEGFHLEQLDHGEWWLEIEHVHVNFWTKRPHQTRIYARAEAGCGGPNEQIDAGTVARWARESHEETQWLLRRFGRIDEGCHHD